MNFKILDIYNPFLEHNTLIFELEKLLYRAPPCGKKGAISTFKKNNIDLNKIHSLLISDNTINPKLYELTIDFIKNFNYITVEFGLLEKNSYIPWHHDDPAETGAIIVPLKKYSNLHSITTTWESGQHTRSLNDVIYIDTYPVRHKISILKFDYLYLRIALKKFDFDYIPRSNFYNIPKLGLGCTKFSKLELSWDEKKSVTDQNTFDIIELAYNNDIKFFDISPLVGNGQGEYKLGNFLRRKPPNEYYIQTKIGRYTTILTDKKSKHWNSAFPDAFKVDYNIDYSYDGIMISYEQSLIRFGVPQIHFLLVHDLCKMYYGSEYVKKLKELESGIVALEELKSNNMILDYGFSMHDEVDIKLIDSNFNFNYYQIAGLHNILNQIQLPKKPIIIGSPYAGGIIAGNKNYNYTEPKSNIYENISNIKNICLKYNVDIKSVSLQYPFKYNQVVSVLTGARTKEQLKENIKYFLDKIPKEIWNEII